MQPTPNTPPLQVRDLNTPEMLERFVLVSNSQEIAAVLEQLGTAETYEALFIAASAGEYTGIYGCESSVPRLDMRLYPLHGLRDTR